MSFDEAVDGLRRLLAAVQWPETIEWVPASHVIAFPDRVFVLRPRRVIDGQRAARTAFEAAARDCPAVRVGAVARTSDATLAAVWPIFEVGQGEAMFIEGGVKIDAPGEAPELSILTSRLRWCLMRRAHARWVQRRDAALVDRSRRD
jgi:hypothetical protein